MKKAMFIHWVQLNWNTSGTYSSETPVAFTKIKNGTTEYDKSFFFNITDASGGQYVYKKLYMGKGNFLLTMVPSPYVYATVFYGSYLGGIKFAVANVYDGSFKWITGIPESITSTSEYAPSYSPLDGTGFVPIYYTDGSTMKSNIFKFDATTPTATAVLGTDGEAAFTSINWLPIK